MKKQENNPLKKLSGMNILYPVLIGLGVVLFFLIKDFDPSVFQKITFDGYRVFFFILLAFLFMALRDLGYMYRIRVLTHNDLSWKKAFRVIMLWEFSSAVMPSAVGGTTVAMIYVNKEGLNFGRSTAVVMATSFLDEIYFILMFPLLLLFINLSDLFAVSSGAQVAFSWTNEFLWFAVVGYLLKLIYTIILSYGLFINPRGLKWLILHIFRLPLIRKYRYNAHLTGTDIIVSSKELKKQKFDFWSKAFFGTFLSWSSRYFVVNAIILAFFAVDDHFLLFSRQLVMSNMMLLFPTPGGSGFSEMIFSNYLRDFIPLDALAAGTMILFLAFLWRLISYYPYLIIGAIIIPGWIKKHFKKKEEHRD